MTIIVGTRVTEIDVRGQNQSTRKKKSSEHAAVLRDHQKTWFQVQDRDVAIAVKARLKKFPEISLQEVVGMTSVPIIRREGPGPQRTQEEAAVMMIMMTAITTRSPKSEVASVGKCVQIMMTC